MVAMEGRVSRGRLSDLGFSIGRLPPGPLNAITDVAGVRVGHVTLWEDTPAVVRTGVTAIDPFIDPCWQENLFAGVHCLNGFGELTGAYWIDECGILTSPIVLSSTFSLGVLRDTMLAHPMRRGEPRRFHQPVCGETNDGLLNDGLAQAIRPEHVELALETASGGRVEEGCVGGGAGMICHEFKGGIGTASRRVGNVGAAYTVGVLAQTNYGRRSDLRIDGVPVGLEIGYDVAPSIRQREEGSIVIVVATDAPLLPQQCARLARRAALGLGRVGGFGGNTSGDFILAFSTANRFPAMPTAVVGGLSMLPNDQMDPIFQGVVEATEEAIVNSMVAADTTHGRTGVAVELPHELLIAAMERHGRRRAP